MKLEDCPKLDECYKVKIILDKDLLGFQYAEAIRAVCARCDRVTAENTRGVVLINNPSIEIKGGLQ